jgi:hypothetical protein
MRDGTFHSTHGYKVRKISGRKEGQFRKERHEKRKD